jgi:hypothetical protein
MRLLSQSSLTGKEDGGSMGAQPVSEEQQMRLALLASAALLVLVPGSAFAQTWAQWPSRTDFFSVAFPGEPSVEQTTHTSEYEGIFPARIYSRVNGRSRFSVRVIDYTDALRIHTERIKSCPPDAQGDCAGGDEKVSGIGHWRYDLFAAMDQVTRTYLQRDAKVDYFGWAVADRVPGRYLHLANLDGSRTYVAIHMHERRLYVLEATVPPGVPEPGLFQQSLLFLDNDGKPVRYDDVYINTFPPPARAR